MAVAATAPEQLWFLNALVTVHVRHDQGEDGISVLHSLTPHGNSPPLHIHESEDEIFHVLDGELRLRVGDADLRIGAGEAIVAPRGVPHTYRVESPEGASYLVITRRGDFEGFVRAVGRPAERPELPAAQGPPTPEQADTLAAAARQHGIEFVGPPLQ